MGVRSHLCGSSTRFVRTRSAACALKARKAAGLSEDLVLYCARHDFGSYLLSKTGNLKAVMDTMGHADVKSAMTYQHPEMEIVRAAINARHISWHTTENANQASS